MSECTVNIADFRCRAIKSRARIFRTTPAPAGLAIVASRHRGDVISMSSAAKSDNPQVYDIGVAREAQRSRQRVLFRPISIQRRAKVLRFHEAPSHAAPLQIAAQAAPRWNPPMHGPYDLPPAA